MVVVEVCMRVLTLNCWGLKYIAQQRVARLRAIGDFLAATEYDVVALQEIWVESEDWRYVKSVCAPRYPHSAFFFAGAFGAGLALLSRHPIVARDTHMYTLTCTPVFVHQGDWIAGKACGCATIAHPDLGLVDVWNTHLTALGGQSGPESRRAFRASEAFELAALCRASVDKGRHVVLMGDLNSLPDSLCLALLRRYALLEDAFEQAGSAECAITCDSPRNTWTAGKHVDALAVQQGGKRLDYVLFRSPAGGAVLRATSLSLVLDAPIPGLGVSYSDHFGVEAELSLAGEQAERTPDCAPLHDTARLLRGAYASARREQATHLGAFGAALAGALAAVIGAACAVAWLSPGSSAGAVAALGVATIAFSWFGTTALYSGVVWGEWHKRAIRGLIARIDTES